MTWIYFIKPIGLDGPIKIGRSAYSAEGRLASMRMSSPFDLEIMHAFEADGILENILHRMFSSYRKHGEWFDVNPELLSLISALKNGRSIDNILDIPHLIKVSKTGSRKRIYRDHPDDLLQKVITKLAKNIGVEDWMRQRWIYRGVPHHQYRPLLNAARKLEISLTSEDIRSLDPVQAKTRGKVKAITIMGLA